MEGGGWSQASMVLLVDRDPSQKNCRTRRRSLMSVVPEGPAEDRLGGQTQLSSAWTLVSRASHFLSCRFSAKDVCRDGLCLPEWTVCPQQVAV